MIAAKSWPDFLIYAWSRFVQNDNRQNAAVLTFTTLFALVPFMTVTYAALSIFPPMASAGEEIQQFIFQHFAPGSGETVQGYLTQFSSQARKLTGVGMLVLFVTTFVLIINIEKTFNKVWQIKEPRKGVSSFLLYWAVISLGPILVGLAFVFSSYFMSLPIINDAANQIGGKQFLFSFLPFLFSMSALTLLYVAVPNCKVKISDGLVGGFLIACFFELAKFGFTQFIALFPTYKFIYGAFAAVPLFLLWMYLSWLLVLFGAELVHGIQTFKQNAILQEKESPIMTLLYLLEQLWLAHKDGAPLSQDELIKKVPLQHLDVIENRVHQLIELKWIVQSDQNDLVLAQDLARVTLNDLQNHLKTSLPDQTVFEEIAKQHVPVWFNETRNRIEQVNYAQRDYMNIEIESLFNNGAES